MKRLLTVLAVALFATFAAANEPSTGGGEVRVPLEVYQDLVARAQAATTQPRPVPARYALGKAQVDVTVEEVDAHATAAVRVTVPLRTFENEWTLVPVLPSATPVRRATVDGVDVTLVASPEGLAWITDKAGSYNLELQYSVDAIRSGPGFVLAIPLPPGATAELLARIKGNDLDVSVIPGVGVSVDATGGGWTRVSASLPPSSAVQVSWRTGAKEGHVISRARYSGELIGDAVFWTATFSVEVFASSAITLPLLPRSVTLSDLSVDGKQATVLTEDGQFATLVKGRGLHDIEISFQVPVVRPKGPPQVNLQIPEIPVSRFDLTLPGDKQATVSPPSSVSAVEADGKTTITVYVPMTRAVTFSWTEAIPEDVRTQVRANASIYHAVHAEEGVLHVRAMVIYEITRGDSSIIELEVPEGVQINKITAKTGGISDWRVVSAEAGKPSLVNVFLDRKIKGELPFDVYYEQLLGVDRDAGEAVRVPLLRAANVHRQRGMVALLSGPDRALNPEAENRVSKVGENQLPAFVREAVTMTIAHTYKYISPDPELSVRSVAPERKRGKFDAQVDSLISIGDVTLKGSATIEVNVKSGALMELELQLAENINVLGLTGPSLRTHQVKAGEGHQKIEVEFTQEMEGQFRLEVSYERILTDADSDVIVPTVSVVGAEVEHGRIAVEALTAVFVEATVTEQLSTVEVSELPQQLVLKTTNPILLAFKYVHAEPPFKLALRMTRHKELDVQDAAIETAHYQSLFTRDGLAVSRATFIVRNSRRQFLRIKLPPKSTVWSVFVAGKPEKPAEADEEAGDGKTILIKMINSADGFPVEVVYKTDVDSIGSLGVVSSHLPRPDMVVTNTRWDVFLPDGIRYKEVDTNMDLITAGAPVAKEAMEATVAPSGDGQMVQPLRINVPTRGVHFAFEKLYANEAEDEAGFSIPYASLSGEKMATVLSVGGAVLLWLGIGFMLRRRGGPMPLVAVMTGGAILFFAVMYLGAGSRPAIITSMVMVIIGVVTRVLAARAQANSGYDGPPPPPGDES